MSGPADPPTPTDRLAFLGDTRLSAITPAPPPERVSDCPFVRTGHRTIFSGRGGTGKSTLQYQIAAACSAGNHYLGAAGDLDYSDLPGGVLILTDEPPARVAQRMARFEPPVPWTDVPAGTWGVEREIDPDRIHVIGINDIDLPMLHEAIDAWSIALLIIDPLRRLVMRGVDREDFDSVWSACETWLPMDLPCATVGLHHQHRERERVQSDSVTKGYGSSAWYDSLDIALDFDRVKGGADGDRVITVGKSRVDDLVYGERIYLEWNDVNTYGYGPGVQQGGTKLKPSKVEGLAERVAAFVQAHPRTTKAATARALGLDPSNRHSASYRLMVEAFEAARAIPCKPGETCV